MSNAWFDLSVFQSGPLKRILWSCEVRNISCSFHMVVWVYQLFQKYWTYRILLYEKSYRGSLLLTTFNIYNANKMLMCIKGIAIDRFLIFNFYNFFNKCQACNLNHLYFKLDSIWTNRTHPRVIWSGKLILQLYEAVVW